MKSTPTPPWSRRTSYFLTDPEYYRDSVTAHQYSPNVPSHLHEQVAFVTCEQQQGERCNHVCSHWMPVQQEGIFCQVEWTSFLSDSPGISHRYHCSQGVKKNDALIWSEMEDIFFVQKIDTHNLSLEPDLCLYCIKVRENFLPIPTYEQNWLSVNRVGKVPLNYWSWLLIGQKLRGKNF